jgi:hypothetical protein
MLPLDHIFPNLFLHTIVHWSGRINQDILHLQDMPCQSLETSGFLCHFVETGGDTDVSSNHKQTFETYQKLGVHMSLPKVVKGLTRTGALMKWPVSDSLHVMRNAHARIARGSLAFDVHYPLVTAKQLTKELDSMNIGTVVEARDMLDLLKDDLALKPFQLGNLLTVWEASEVTGAFFMFPLVTLNLATRNPAISVWTKISLLEVAFHVVFEMATSPAGLIWSGAHRNRCARIAFSHDSECAAGRDQTGVDSFRTSERGHCQEFHDEHRSASVHSLLQKPIWIHSR